MYKEIVQNKDNSFYPVSDENVAVAENELGINFPQALKDFYSEVGYGFIESKRDNFNRIMGPGSVCEFRLRKGQFANDYELEVYEAYEKDTLIFFEICEGCYLAIGFTKANYGKIFDGNTVIAESLGEFLVKYQEDERYFE